MKKQSIIIVVLVLGVLFLGFTTILERKSVKAIRLEIQKIEQKNDSLLMGVSILERKVLADSLKMVNSKLKIDSLMASDSLNKQKLKVISWKYGKLKNDYDSATDVVKDSIFAELINN